MPTSDLRLWKLRCFGANFNISRITRFLCYFLGLKFSSVLLCTLFPSLEQSFTWGANYDEMLTLPISEPIEFTVSSWSEHGTEKIRLSFLLSVSWLCYCIGDFETIFFSVE